MHVVATAVNPRSSYSSLQGRFLCAATAAIVLRSTASCAKHGVHSAEGGGGSTAGTAHSCPMLYCRPRRPCKVLFSASDTIPWPAAALLFARRRSRRARGLGCPTLLLQPQRVSVAAGSTVRTPAGLRRGLLGCGNWRRAALAVTAAPQVAARAGKPNPAGRPWCSYPRATAACYSAQQPCVGSSPC